MSQTPLEIYNFMDTEVICTKRANFYVSWAWELEQLGNFKKAEQVFVKGHKALIAAIAEGASTEEEKAVLHTKHKQFQVKLNAFCITVSICSSLILIFLHH